MWFHVTREGKPIRKRRYAFSESFAAIAYGELAQATGEDQYAEKAERTFHRFIDHNLDPKGTEPKFTATRPAKGLGFPSHHNRNRAGTALVDQFDGRRRVDRPKYRRHPAALL